jgi:hypothetical protein
MKPLSPRKITATNLRKLGLSVFLIWTILGLLVYGCGSDQAAQPTHYPEEGTPQAVLYIAKCGQCHGAPLPTAHTASVWPGVLDRMQVHIQASNVARVSREEMSIILGYLQQNAKKPATQQESSNTQAGTN